MLRGRPAIPDGPARPGSWCGAVWSIAIALTFFFLSSPLALVPDFADSLLRAVWATTLACALTLSALRTPRAPWAALPFLGFCLVSSAWAITPSDTVHFLGLYVVLTVLGVVTAANVGTRVLANGILGGAVIVMATSVYAYWQDLPGSHVPAGTSGFLAGVGTNRNILAYTMILAFPFAAGLVPRGRAPRLAWGLAVLVVLSGILLAESATGIVAVAVVTGAALALARRERLLAQGSYLRKTDWTAAGAVLLTLATAVAAWYLVLDRDFQRDLSLTGRVGIWEAAWDNTSARARIVGDGFGSVWMHPWRIASPNGQFEAINTQIGYYEPHGHNSVMDLVPEVGLVGVGLFALIYVAPLLRVARRRRQATIVRDADRVVVLGIVALVLAGITEPISTVPLGFYIAVLLLAHDPGLDLAPPPAREPAAGAGVG